MGSSAAKGSLHLGIEFVMGVGGIDPCQQFRQLARKGAPTAGAWLGNRETTVVCRGSTGARCSDRPWFGLATVMADLQSLPGPPDSVPPPRLLDRQGCSTLAAGVLLLLISFTTNDGDDNLFQLGTLPAPGVLLEVSHNNQQPASG